MRKKLTCIFICTLLITVFLVNINVIAFQKERMILNNSPIESYGFLEDIVDDVGWFTSLDFDSNNFPHISYYDYTNGDLKYARWTGSEWSLSSVDTDGNVGRYTSLVLDEEDNPHISYYDYTKEDLKYAYFSGSSWSIKKVDGTGKVGLYSSIALDDEGLPHISYCDYTNRALKYAYWDGDSWNKKIVDNTGDICVFEYFGDTTSIVIDSNGFAHISYCDYGNYDLKYAYQYDSTWSVETVDSEGFIGHYSSLVLDDNNNPHICYGDLTNDNFDLKYAVKNNDDWEIEKINSENDIRKWISLKLDTQNNPHISFYDYYEGSLVYTYWDGGDWVIDTVESAGSTGCFNCLFLDSSDNPYISYYDWGSKALKYASLEGDTWLVETIEVDTNSDLLDQEQKYCCGYAFLIEEARPYAQAFKPTYKTLTRVELMIVKRYNPGGLEVCIRKDLDGADLTSINLTSADIAEDLSWKNFNLPDIQVTPEDTYFIVCNPYGNEYYQAFYWYFGIYDSYPEGESWIKNPYWKKFSYSGFPDIDYGFKTYGLDTDLPSKPDINGPSHGKVRTEITYSIISTDPDGDDVSYFIDWGDGDIENTGYYPSGEEVSVSHTWNRIKNYLLKVKAVDSNGAESDWTELQVSIPRSKMFIDSPILALFRQLLESLDFQKIISKLFF